MSQKLAVAISELPDEALVKIPVALALTGKSRSVVYTESKLGRFPPIIKIGNSRASGLRLGEIRRYLQDPAGYRAPK